MRKVGMFVNQVNDKKCEVFIDENDKEFPYQVKFYRAGTYLGTDCDYPAETRKEADHVAIWWANRAA